MANTKASEPMAFREALARLDSSTLAIVLGVNKTKPVLPPEWDPDGVYRLALVGNSPIIQKHTENNQWIPAPLGRDQKTATPVAEPLHEIRAMQNPQSVFIIHGRNFAAKNAVEQFLRSLKLEPIDFDELAADLGAAFIGDIVREGMRRAQGILAVFTADEIASLRSEYHQDHDSPEDKSRWQSRPNVIFEAGMAYGSAPDRTILAVLGSETKLFSDVKGMHLTFLGNGQDARGRLRQKLIGAKCDVDLRSTAWLDPARSGDFDACMLPAAPVTPTTSSPRRALTDAAALLRLEGWLKKLPDDKYDDAIFTDDVDKACELSPGTTERLIAQVVARAGGDYALRGPTDGVIMLTYEMQIVSTSERSREDRYRR